MTITVKDSAGSDVTVITPDDVNKLMTKATKTRPANTTAYSAGDLVGNDTTAGSVTPFSFTGATIAGGAGSGDIVGIDLQKSTQTNEFSVVVHFFNFSPTVTNGDNGALVISNWDQDGYIGSVPVTMFAKLGGGMIGRTSCLLPYRIASGDTIYAHIEANQDYTPGSSETFTLRPAVKRLS